MSVAASPSQSLPLSIPPAGRGELPSGQADGRARLVVIDDEPLNTAALAESLQVTVQLQLLSLLAHEATTQRLRDERPDLILLDAELDQVDAFEVLRDLRADRCLRHVPVIMLSTVDDQISRVRALELGVVDFLVKPVDVTELGLRLRNVLVAKAHRDRLAHTDPLTGLPSRESMGWRLDWSLKHALRHGTVGAVLQLGLGRIEQVVDALGPAAVDDLLLAVSLRLMAGLRDSDTVARDADSHLSAMLARARGEEFTLLLPIVERADAAAVVAQRMVDRMAEPFMLAGHEIVVPCHVGIAVFPGDSTDKDTVLQCAAAALHAATQGSAANGHAFQFFSDELNVQSLQRLTLERDLHLAFERNEFCLHYQAQVDVASRRLCGAEALLRWQHPKRGLVGPQEFIGIAEECGLIVKLGEWVLRSSLNQLSQWRRDGLQLPKLSVNVSGVQLQRTDLGDIVKQALRHADLDGASLCLELTESTLIDSGVQVNLTLAALKKLGVHLALDDFGTGFSSLTCLRRLPIDELKIDRSFVMDCDRDAGNAALTSAIITLAHQLDLRVVAEGVETPQQFAFLRERGADAFQGFVFAKPLPAAQFRALLADELKGKHWRGGTHRVSALVGNHVAQPGEESARQNDMILQTG